MRATRILSTVAGLVLVVMPVGCATDANTTPESTLLVAEDEFREINGELADRMIAAIKAGARSIAAGTGDRRIRQRTVLWQARVVSMIQEHLFEEDPRRSFLGMWVLAMQQHEYFTEGEGRLLFEDQQSTAISASKEILDDFDRTTARYGQAGIVDKARPEVEQFARTHPMYGTFRIGIRTPADDESMADTGPLRELLSIPLVPFRAVGGVDNAALAVREVAVAADRMSRVAADMPEQFRWQAQILAYDIEDRETAQTLRDASTRVADSMESFSVTADEFSRLGDDYALIAREFRTAVEEMPGEVRAEATALLEDFDARQGELQNTLASARETVAEFDATIKSADGLARSLEGTTTSLADAGAAWEQVVTAVDEMVANMRTPQDGAASPAASDAAADGTPFDINDYRLAAEEARALAVELQTLVRELGTLSSSGTFVTSLSETVEGTTVGLRGLINVIMWRAIILVGVIFVAAVAYRAISVRMTKRVANG